MTIHKPHSVVAAAPMLDRSRPGKRRRGHLKPILMAVFAVFAISIGAAPVGALASGPSCPVPPGTTGVTDVGCADQLQLDGNIPHDTATSPPWDWAPGTDGSGGVMTAAGDAQSQSSTHAIDNTGVIPDYSQPDNSYFHGSATDTENSSTWKCVTQNNATNKDDLLNAYAVVFQPSSGPRTGDRMLYVASERETNNGNAYAGFWLLQNSTTCDPSVNGGLFSTTGHTTNDILLLANYTGGGSVAGLSVMRWDPTAPNNLRLVDSSSDCQNVTAAADSCGRVNSIAQTPPWPNSTGGSTAEPEGDFLEIGVDLTALGLDHNGSQTICTSTFLAESRSSQQATATLKDFASGRFNLCAATTLATDNSATANAAVGSSIFDTATLTGTAGNPLPNATGTVTYNLYSGSACTGTPVFSDQVTVSGGSVPDSAPYTVTAPGTYEWQAVYSGDTSARGIDQGSSSTCGDEPVRAGTGPALATNSAGIAGSSQNGVAGVPMQVGDTASLSGFSNLASDDTITFSLYGPTSSTPAVCSNRVLGPFQEPVDSTTGTAGTGLQSFTPTASGTYYWLATFSGDANNQPIATAVGCGDPAEAVTVVPTGVLGITDTPLADTGGSTLLVMLLGLPLVLFGLVVLAITRRRSESGA